MSEKKLSEASLNWHILNWIAIIGMIGTSIYLTNHYFEIKYPSSNNLSGGSLCDINSFFTCSATTNSGFSNIFGVPISIFGLFMGLFFGFGYFVKNQETEGTNHFLSLLNVVGCLFLFLYSLIGLGTLCPFCSVYYIFSALAAFVFFKHSGNRSPSIKYLAIYGIIIALVAGLTWNHVQGKSKTNDKYAESLISQFFSLPDLGKPRTDSPFLVAKAADTFDAAAVRITKFSDFECGACGILSEHLIKIAEKYKGHITIQYKFYPLDASCNAAIKRQLHQNACSASYLAYCAPEQFSELHHEIFEIVSAGRLTPTWLKEKAKKLGIEACYNAKETKEAVVAIIDEAKPFNVSSTPTTLINGVKIEGVRPLKDYYIIIDEIIKRSKK